MVKIEDLKRINLLKDFPNYLLEIIAKEAQLSIFGTDTQLFEADEDVHIFYMLIMGQVALTVKLTSDIDVILDYVQSGSSFCSSALIKGVKAPYSAVCQEPCEVITLSGKSMIPLFKENHELAYHMMFGVAKQYKKHLDTRAQMIMKTLDEHPEFKEDINDIENLTLVI